MYKTSYQEITNIRTGYRKRSGTERKNFLKVIPQKIVSFRKVTSVKLVREGIVKHENTQNTFFNER